MTTAPNDLWRKAECFRRRYQRLLPAGLTVNVEAKHLLTGHRGPGRRPGPMRVVVRYLLQVFANQLCGEDLPGLFRGQWVCSLGWNAGFAPRAPEVLWAAIEGVARLEREHRAWSRHLARRQRLYDRALARGFSGTLIDYFEATL